MGCLLQYFSLLLVVFIGIGAGAGLSYAFRQKIDNQMHELMMEEFKQYTDNSTVKTVIDDMQSEVRNFSYVPLLVFLLLW